MYKIIGADGKEYGPVSAEQLRQWVREQRANAQSMVQAEGSTTWRPLSAFAEFADLFGAAPTPAPTSPVDPRALGDAILQHGYHLDIGWCLSRAWQLYKSNFGLLFGCTLLILVIEAVIRAIGDVPRSLIRITDLRNIPVLAVVIGLSVVSGLASMILTGPLTGGLYWVFLLRLRNQAATVGDAFAGFHRGFLNLMLTNILVGLLAALCVVPGFIALAAAVGIGYSVSHGAGLMVAVVAVALLLAGAVAAIYLSVSWFFALPLAVDKQIGFWDAMCLSRRVVTVHWWRVFGFLIVTGLIVLAGAFVCCVGLLFTIPFGIAAVLCAYEKIFCAA